MLNASARLGARVGGRIAAGRESFRRSDFLRGGDPGLRASASLRRRGSAPPRASELRSPLTDPSPRGAIPSAAPPLAPPFILWGRMGLQGSVREFRQPPVRNDN